jgi:hypothetical protein
MALCGCLPADRVLKSPALFTSNSLTFGLVNERSILAIKKRALRRTRTLARDSESQTARKPSWISALVTKAKAPFTRVYWEDVLEKTDAESLVDGQVLSYAYLEVGLIETLAVFVLLLLLHPVFLCTNNTYQTRRVLRCFQQGWFHSQGFAESPDCWWFVVFIRCLPARVLTVSISLQDSSRRGALLSSTVAASPSMVDIRWMPWARHSP